MPVHNPTISDLVGHGYVDLNIHCGNCRFIVVYPLQPFLQRAGHLTTMAALEARLKCRRCGNKPAWITAKLPEIFASYRHT